MDPKTDLSWHINKEGLSNTVLENLLVESKVPSSFKGIFSCDNIPLHLTHEKCFSIIVNIGYHFISVIAKNQFIIYIDSFGSPAREVNINDFLLKCERPVFYNTSQIQSFSSTFCGFYACLFIIFFSKKSENPLKLSFHTDEKKLKMNDALCITYIKILLNVK